VGIVEGFQWIDGSFIEDAEKSRGRPPADIDIITFGGRPAGYAEKDAWAEWCAAHFAVWKGMIELPLASDDEAAMKILEGVLDGQTA
jgi:hypothetical protein